MRVVIHRVYEALLGKTPSPGDARNEKGFEISPTATKQKPTPTARPSTPCRPETLNHAQAWREGRQGETWRSASVSYDHSITKAGKDP